MNKMDKKMKNDGLIITKSRITTVILNLSYTTREHTHTDCAVGLLVLCLNPDSQRPLR